MLTEKKFESFDRLPPGLIEYFESMEYCEIIRPLVVADSRAGKHLQQMANFYSISIKQVRTILRKGGSTSKSMPGSGMKVS